MTSPVIDPTAPTRRIVSDRRGSRLVDQVGAYLVHARAWGQIRLLTDAIVLYVAAAGALFADPNVAQIGSNRWVAAGFPLLALAMLHARQGSHERLRESILGNLANVLGVVSLAAMSTIAGQSLIANSQSLGIAPRLWLFSVVYLGGVRAVLISARNRALRVERLATPTLIVGAGRIGALLVKRLNDEPSYGLFPVGFLDADPLTDAQHTLTRSVPVLGGHDNLAEAITATGARHVILAFSSEPDHLLVAKARQCDEIGVGVSLVPRLYESINERATLDYVGGLPLLTLRNIDPRSWQFAIKHAFDRSVAALSLVVVSPIMLALAIAVRLSSPGPILFRQPRIGRDGHEFTMLKFRSMRGSPLDLGEADATWAAGVLSGPETASDEAAVESRVTRVGRLMRTTSLDELPQLINVIRGDMSLVGPRPERVAYVRDFERFVARYSDRHRVKSGITGWAQVNGLRGQTSVADRVEWDNYYIRNWSVWLDLRIIFLTIAEILKFRG
ncbi:MAG: exopolysaccharide biosynthesis polyprenyl glycosylphosphotransferase [Actinomycetota bacterium]|nr:exopolysaccharide biosynthesis polyprenyl glycosylphosphotransferase [Actinomycetota bacterium]